MILIDTNIWIGETMCVELSRIARSVLGVPRIRSNMRVYGLANIRICFFQKLKFH